jgi:hypothetical protein
MARNACPERGCGSRLKPHGTYTYPAGCPGMSVGSITRSSITFFHATRTRSTVIWCARSKSSAGTTESTMAVTKVWGRRFAPTTAGCVKWVNRRSRSRLNTFRPLQTLRRGPLLAEWCVAELTWPLVPHPRPVGPPRGVARVFVQPPVLGRRSQRVQSGADGRRRRDRLRAERKFRWRRLRCPSPLTRRSRTDGRADLAEAGVAAFGLREAHTTACPSPALGTMLPGGRTRPNRQSIVATRWVRERPLSGGASGGSPTRCLVSRAQLGVTSRSRRCGATRPPDVVRGR